MMYRIDIHVDSQRSGEDITAIIGAIFGVWQGIITVEDPVAWRAREEVKNVTVDEVLSELSKRIRRM